MSNSFIELLRDDFSAELKDSDPWTVINAYEGERHRAADRIEALEKALIEMRNTVYLHPVRIGDSEAEMNAFSLTTRALLEISKKMKVILADASVKAID